MQEKTQILDNPVGQTPLIGLALGGGVARGFAHIGVLKQLDKFGYNIDVIAGTSIGAVAGACYLAGALDVLEEWALRQTKTKFWASADYIMNGTGIIGGKKFSSLLRKAIGTKNIEDLEKGLIIVCTELTTGHEIWLKRGDIVESIMASYALPGLFPAVNIGGRWMIDGALVNPLPISVCRAMGARLVIACGLHQNAFELSTIKMQEKINPNVNEEDENLIQKLSHMFNFDKDNNSNDNPPGIFQSMTASFNILMDRITRARLAGDPPDIMIYPKVSEFSLFDFDKGKELIELGKQSVIDNQKDIDNAINILSK